MRGKRWTAFLGAAAAAGVLLTGCTGQGRDSSGGKEPMETKSGAASSRMEKTVSSYGAWLFEGNDGGFAAAAGDTLEIGENALRYTAGTAGRLDSPGGLDIPAGAVRTVEVRLKGDAVQSLTLAWAGADGTFAQENQVSIPLEADGKYHDYQIDLAGQPGWSGQVSRLRFITEAGGVLEIDSIRLSGLYLVPFPWLSGDFTKDLYQLKEIQEAFRADNHTVTVGFSALVQYLSDTDDEENIAMEYRRSVEYYVKLAKAADMPVMIWLRADPWAEPYTGVAQKLYADDRNLMWTEELTAKPAYRKDLTGYFNYCLAQTDLSGAKTPYWQYTEKLLGQCAQAVNEAVQENPEYILGVTTTSEYRYLTDGQEHILDYNPHTIREFRDWCREKYGTVDALNAACSTSFTTWELRSADYDPATVENAGGFDAPRERFTPSAFWDDWSAFRAQQITTAETRLVEIIGEHLDSKYIYTHQIPYADHTTASPITTGNVPGSNIGIDFFNHDVTAANMEAITSMLGGDVSRTWGVPEWLVTHSAPYESTDKALRSMAAAGVKYLCPFNWGSGDEYDVKGSPAEKAIADFVAEREAMDNPMAGVSVNATAGFADAQALVDGSLGTVFSAASFKAGDWISFDLGEERTLSSVTLYPAGQNGSLPVQVTVQTEQDGAFKTAGTYTLAQLDAAKPADLYFDPTVTRRIKLIIDEPAKNSSGETIFSLAEIRVGNKA